MPDLITTCTTPCGVVCVRTTNTPRTCKGLVVCGQLPEQDAVRVHVTGAAAAPMHQQLWGLQGNGNIQNTVAAGGENEM
jgi:hypothetical protein